MMQGEKPIGIQKEQEVYIIYYSNTTGCGVQYIIIGQYQALPYDNNKCICKIYVDGCCTSFEFLRLFWLFPVQAIH